MKRSWAGAKHFAGSLAMLEGWKRVDGQTLNFVHKFLVSCLGKNTQICTILAFILTDKPIILVPQKLYINIETIFGRYFFLQLFLVTQCRLIIIQIITHTRIVYLSILILLYDCRKFQNFCCILCIRILHWTFIKSHASGIEELSCANLYIVHGYLSSSPINENVKP